MSESVSEAGRRWLGRRVRVYAGFDHRKQHHPMVEGVVVGYAAHPTICVRSDDGRQSDWQVTLPITVLAEDAEIPLAADQRPVPPERIEQIARWLHGEFGGPFPWAEGPDWDRAIYLNKARTMAEQLGLR